MQSLGAMTDLRLSSAATGDLFHLRFACDCAMAATQEHVHSVAHMR